MIKIKNQEDDEEGFAPIEYPEPEDEEDLEPELQPEPEEGDLEKYLG